MIQKAEKIVDKCLKQILAVPRAAASMPALVIGDNPTGRLTQSGLIFPHGMIERKSVQEHNRRSLGLPGLGIEKLYAIDEDFHNGDFIMSGCGERILLTRWTSART